MEGVQFNWANFLYMKFMMNCHEAQEKGKTFHYAWLLLSIVIIAGELPKDSQFPTINKELPEVVKCTSLWAMKDVKRICDSKIFGVFMEMNIQTWINRKPCLSPKV